MREMALAKGLGACWRSEIAALLYGIRQALGTVAMSIHACRPLFRRSVNVEASSIPAVLRMDVLKLRSAPGRGMLRRYMESLRLPQRSPAPFRALLRSFFPTAASRKYRGTNS